jgi:CRP-like cAMP-binding protein
MLGISLENKIQYIEQQHCFHQLTPQEKEVLATLLIEKEFKAGETIVNEGELVDCVYLIMKGKADVRKLQLNSQVFQTQSIATLGEGEAIGLNETGFYSLTGKRTATVVALTDLETLSLSVAAFHGFALAHSHVNEIMHQQAEEFLKF